MVAKVHVFCSVPGRVRGGRANPRHEVYEMGAHSPDQMRELLADDQQITVVIGDALTEADIEKMEAKAPAKAKA